jgi:Flp pilus assembly protein TadG
VAPRPRRGAVTVELILGLPILLIGVLAIVEFGMFFARLEQVALSCRAGAEEASQTTPLPGAGDPIPGAVETVILKQLDNSCILPCAIILEHNVGGQEQTSRTDYDNDGDSAPDCPLCQEPSSSLPANSVRVTVCVQLTELMPNCLAALGFDITGQTTQCSTVFGHE